MLSKLLAYLRAGGDANISTISRKLEIEEGTIVMLLDQLVKIGYLEIIEPLQENLDNCPPTKCSSCSKIINCSLLLTAKYRLVEKN